MSKEQRKELGQKGISHVMKNYNFDDFTKRWDDLFTKIYEERGSWASRKKYKAWELIEIT